MTFLFFAIAIGLCCGANAWMVALIGTSTMALVTIIFSKVGHDNAGSADYILIFRSDRKAPWDEINAEAQSLISWKQLRGATDLDHGKDFEYTYSVRLASKAKPESIVGELSNGVMRQVTLITPENHLEL